MPSKKNSTGVVHKIPSDFKRALVADPKAFATWEDITPLARNEWICWVISPKQPETRIRRIKVGLSKLRGGMRRPCCWAGCTHR
ncbi:MAG: YdeI/OmpD-associated family protein [Candidatus Nomurabacteria bacterium]|nr:YdeI/OmpD-associated family protein [Candidatus Nomurabacteria bacterium]